ncbi:MAG: AsmA-like C-terminal region-containing protein [Pseudomonadota bacterium]
MKQSRRHRKVWVRFLFGTIVAAGLVALVSGIALPFAISTDLVRDKLERDISQWTGHEVVLLDSPELGFWPAPHISLKRISVSSRKFPEAEPIVYADEMRADFSILSALIGDPSFSNFVLVRPIFWVEQFPEGNTTWNSQAGRISEGVGKTIRQAEAAAGGEKSTERVPDYRLGDVTVENGTFTWINHITSNSEKITALNGVVRWPRLNGEMEAEISGIYRGEAARLWMETEQPLMILAHRTSQIEIEFASTPLTLAFNGTANLSPLSFASGTFSMQSPSMRQTLAWAGAEIKPGEAIGALSLDAELQLQNSRAMLDKLILELEGNRAIGVLDFKYADGIPGVSGTLAFNSLDLTSFLRAFTPLPQTGEDIADTIDTSFLNELVLDMRLSAQSAKLGPLSLSNVAAAARIDEGRATFDIGDATAYGGSLQGRVVLAESGIEGGGEVRISASDIDMAQALAALNVDGPFPRGTARMNMSLSTPFPTWATGLSDIAGKFDLTITDGFLPSFDPAQFRTQAEIERFFGLDGLSSGSFPFATAEFEAIFANGIAEVSKGEIIGQNAVLSLAGIIPYQRGGLALIGELAETATVASTSQDSTPDNSMEFFVGGSWPTPVISPIAGN